MCESPDKCHLWFRCGDQRLDLLLLLSKHPPQQGLVVRDEGGDPGVGVAGPRPAAHQLVESHGAGQVLDDSISIVHIHASCQPNAGHHLHFRGDRSINESIYYETLVLRLKTDYRHHLLQTILLIKCRICLQSEGPMNVHSQLSLELFPL